VTAKLVILDRDGVINKDSDGYIKSVEEWEAIPGSLEAIARLNHFGFKVVVVTNQSGLARGLFSMAQMNAIHQKMRQELDQVGGQLDGIFFCPHGPDDHCECRKPLPGLLLEVRDRLGVDLNQTLVIGDSYRDLQSAWAVGAQGLLVKTGKGVNTLVRYGSILSGTEVFTELSSAAESIISKSFTKASL